MADDVVKINRIEDFYTLDPGRDYIGQGSYQGKRPNLRAVGTPQQLRAIYDLFGREIISFSVKPYEAGARE